MKIRKGIFIWLKRNKLLLLLLLGLLFVYLFYKVGEGFTLENDANSSADAAAKASNAWNSVKVDDKTPADVKKAIKDASGSWNVASADAKVASSNAKLSSKSNTGASLTTSKNTAKKALASANSAKKYSETASAKCSTSKIDCASATSATSTAYQSFSKLSSR